MSIINAIETRCNILRNWLLYGSGLNYRTRRVKLPKDTRKMGRVHVICVKGGIIELGKNVTLRSDPFCYQGGMPFGTTLLVDREGGRIDIGDNCRINGVYVHAKKDITIGRNCVIAAGVNIIDQNGHELISKDRTIGTDEPKPIKIEDNVWICSGSYILKGTHIGKNSVVSAGSVVKGDFPADSLIQGNPAKVVSVLSMEK